MKYYNKNNLSKNSIWMLMAGSLLLASSISVFSCKRGTRESSTTTVHSNVLKTDNKPIKFKFFLERSGSMTPFDATATSGDFKDAIFSLLNSIPENDDTENLLYVVNDSVYNYEKSYADFISCTNIFDDTKDIGDPRYTDFTCIFSNIMERTGKNELSILVSDLIYSTKNMSSVTKEKIVKEAKNMTTHAFKKHSGKRVLVIKMIGDYSGNYYSYNNPSKGVFYSGKRPYYFVMVSSPEVMKKLFTLDKYKDFVNFKSYNGYQDFYCFSEKDNQPEFSVLLTNPRIDGRYGAVRGQEKLIHNINNAEPNRDGIFSVTIAVDLSNVIVSEEVLKDKNNYQIDSQSGYSIKSVDRINDKDRMDVKLSQTIPNATHFITLTTNKRIKNETVSVSLNNKLPKWIYDTNSDDDTDIYDSNFSTSTFAFKSLMKGIYDVYYGTTDVPSFFKFDINIKK